MFLTGETLLKKENKISNMEKSFTAISMFSGCGGMDLGFYNAGFKIIWANDIDSDSCETYRRNFQRLTGEDNLQEGDIIDVKRPSKETVDQVTVVLGGFPCQAYSNAGLRNGIQDERGQLYEYCIDFIEEYRPQFTVFENVRGLLTIPGKKHRLIDEIALALDQLGYEVHIKLINSSNYNVPQNRIRIFMVGVKRGEEMPIYRFPSPTKKENLELKHILDVPCDTPNQFDVVQLNPQAYKIGALVPEGGSWKDIPYEQLPPRLKKIKDNIRKYRWPNFYRRFSREEVAGTITAAFKPENAGVWHPTKDRTFSAREIARIQSFPDDFEFFGESVKSIYKMIGNAVPPQLARMIAESIITSILGQMKETITQDYYYVRSQGKPVRPDEYELIFNPNSEYSPMSNINGVKIEQLEFL